MVTREVSVAEKESFDHLATHITQSFEWGDFRQETKGVVEILRLGAFEGQKMVRAYQIFFHKTPITAHIIAYLPRVAIPSLLAEWEIIKKACREKGAIYLKIEPEKAAKPGEIEEMGGTRGDDILPRHDIIIDITKPEDDLLLGMHEKTRYNIKLAQKAGVMVAEKDDPQSLEKFIELYEATQKRQGFFAKNDGYIRTLWKVLRPAKMVYLLGAYVQDEMVAAGMFFNFNGVFYFPYGGWSAQHREKMPNNLLHFEAIKLGKKLGAKHYDFWSSYKNSPDPSDPWYGTYVFKKGFGGEETNYPGAYDFVFNKPVYSLLKIANAARWKFLRIKRLLHF